MERRTLTTLPDYHARLGFGREAVHNALVGHPGTGTRLEAVWHDIGGTDAAGTEGALVVQGDIEEGANLLATTLLPEQPKPRQPMVVMVPLNLRFSVGMGLAGLAQLR